MNSAGNSQEVEHLSSGEKDSSSAILTSSNVKVYKDHLDDVNITSRINSTEINSFESFGKIF